MKRTILIIIISLLLLNCKKENDDAIRYYKSKNIALKIFFDSKNKFSKSIQYYDTVGNLEYKIVYRKKEYDSIVYKYKNKLTYKKGLQDFKGRKFGNWNRYTNNGLLSETREYFIIENDYLINRQWYFDKKGDTLWFAKKFNRYNQKEFSNDTLASRNSSMIRFKIYSKDTIDIDEPFAACVICNSPLLREYNSQIIMLLGKENQNFNKTFSNVREVKLDTFHNLNLDKINRKNFVKANPNYVAAFGRWFDKPGKKVLRGYMLEYYDRKPTAKDSSIRGERKVYFEKEIFVKGK